MPLTLPEEGIQEEYTLHCKRCGGADASVSSSTGPHRRDIGDGIAVIATVNVRCTQCNHLTCYGIADAGGVVKVLALEKVRL